MQFRENFLFINSLPKQDCYFIYFHNYLVTKRFEKFSSKRSAIFTEFTETIETISAVHTTKEAQQKMIDLYCYKCDSMVDGDKCQDIKENATSLSVKCPGDQKSCKVCHCAPVACWEIKFNSHKLHCKGH